MNHDDVKELLIDMRRYIIHHGVLIGECVAWDKLKVMFGVGVNDDAEKEWVNQRIREKARRRRKV